MKLFLDFLPIILFFIAYKIGGIYYATAIAMIASLLQVVFHRVRYKHFEKTHLISFFVILFSGGATLFFRDPMFIKWKPTSIYWIASFAFIFSAFFGKKPLIQRMLEANVSLPANIWLRLNYAWCLFFAFMGSANLYVAYHYSTDTWVNFKLFGCTGMTLVFILLHGFYLPKHLAKSNLSRDGKAFADTDTRKKDLPSGH